MTCLLQVLDASVISVIMHMNVSDAAFSDCVIDEVVDEDVEELG
jgi:hypothetical protein